MLASGFHCPAPPCPTLAWQTREAREPASLGGCAVPVGTQVVLIAWSLHHDARLFPEPEAFRCAACVFVELGTGWPHTCSAYMASDWLPFCSPFRY